MSKPSPRYDRLREMRESRYLAEQSRQRGEGVKPVRRKKVKAKRGK